MSKLNDKDIADTMFTIANRMWARAYEASVGDVISVSLDTFMKNSTLWRNCWQIQEFYEQRLTRRFLWWKRFPRLKKIVMVKLMYVGEDDDTSKS